MLKKKLKYKKLNWVLLYQLLESGYSLNESMIFFDSLQKDDLDKVSFYDLYIKNKKGSFYNNLHFFYSLFPLHQAIKNSLKMEDFKKNIIQKLIKNSLYPLFILIISISILLFFGLSILPQLARDFDVDSILFVIVQKLPFILNFINIFIGGILILIGLLYLLNKTIFYYLIKNLIILIPLFKQIHSFYFLGYYTQLYECGLSSRTCMEYLMKLKTYTVFKEMINELNFKLNRGKNLVDCIKNNKLLSKECRETILMAFQTKKQVNFYQQGLKIIEYRITTIIKKTTRIITMISYLVVLLVVLIMYQLMLIPLDMIQNM